MSSTWVAEFDNEKDYNHFVARFNEIAPDGGNIIVPETPLNPDQVRLRGAWVDTERIIYDFCENFNEDIHGEPPLKDPAWAVSFDIAIWDDWTKSFIIALIQEMCGRYSFVEIGCTSGDLTSPKRFMKWSVFSDYNIRLMVIMKDGPFPVPDEDIEKMKKGLEKVEKTFREAAKRFFDGDASDLILTFEEEV